MEGYCIENSSTNYHKTKFNFPQLSYELLAAGILTVLQGKLNKLLSGDDIKSIQRILISLGHISVKETSFEQIQCALDLIFSLCRSKV